MSRKAGTPNKKKDTYTAAIAETEKIIKQITEDYEYVICEANNKNDLAIMVRESMRDLNYQCQGGVSVTNYRADNGSITMVYCQAMVKRE
jgi:L-lactate utilization protein LutB